MTGDNEENRESLSERRRRAWGVTSDDSGVLARLASRAASSELLRSGHPFARVTRLDRWLVRKMLAAVGDPPVSIVLWNGEEASPAVADPVARVVLHDRMAMLSLIKDPELHFGDLYSSGRVELEGDLVHFLEVIYTSIVDNRSLGALRRFILWLGHRRIRNSPERARDNIYHHYDLGNDFYRLWLDRAEMQYTCAYFPDPTMSLEEGQTAKLHHVCRKLRLQPGERVVEAGCGWGGLALFMARHYGVRVTAYNISRAQVEYARQRAKEEGLSDRVEYVLDDYRNITGEYDAFVSVGMLEHVGVRDYPVLGEVITRCLKPHGRALIHTIGRNRPGPMNAWIERRIFPGACPPSLGQMMAILEPGDFAVQDVENLRLHYALTLRHWLDNFERQAERIEGMMDDAFVRAWRLYLAGSLAAFNSGQLQLFQVLFTPGRNNDLPWSRAHLYLHGEARGETDTIRHEAG
ncbi:MAG TPA: class I SAM-dependent methyltransferase [Sedimenticola thiotaurini]|uniref:Class I SAM-dependent methyltransferase n=1 Tax=Sedimenticola thiotaurini TaxID=1543721 RepID=A0A831W8F9_9GAMM|nr:class I SAM-dependent methyltransferase [Sedimenticola thiotaurini]